MKRWSILGVALLATSALLVCAWWYHWWPFEFSYEGLDRDAAVPPRGLPQGDFLRTYWTEQRRIRQLATAVDQRPLSKAEWKELLEYSRRVIPAYAVGSLMVAVRHCVKHSDKAARLETLPVVVDTLRHQDAVMRRVALRSLGRLNAVEQIPSVLPFLQSTDEEDRIVATQVLKKLGYQVQEPSPGR